MMVSVIRMQDLSEAIYDSIKEAGSYNKQLKPWEVKWVCVWHCNLLASQSLTPKIPLV